MNAQKTFLALCATGLTLTCSVRAQGSLTPPGAPEPTMRTLDQIEPRTPIASLPFTITQPGAYAVVKNLSSAAGGISVQASDVTIDLNGFTLSGDRAVAGQGITVAAGCDNVTIRNGTVRSWGGDGVHAASALHVAVDDLWVEDCVGHGVAMASGSIGNLTSQGNGGAGVFCSKPISGVGIVVKRNPGSSSARLLSNSGGGLVLQGACDIEFSGQTSGNTGDGIAWSSQSPDAVLRVRLTDCDVSHNTGSGLHISDASAVHVVCSTRACSFLDNGGDGVAVLLSHANAGLQLDLREGSSSGNGGYGMNIEEGDCKENRNVVIDVVVNFNDLGAVTKMDVGSAPSLFSRVTARGNGGRGLTLEGGTWTLENCTISDNVSDGLHAVMRTPAGGTAGKIRKVCMTCVSCDISRNGGGGVLLVPDAGGTYKVSIQDLHVYDNAASGFSCSGAYDVDADKSSFLGNGGNGVTCAATAAGQACRVALSSCEVGGNTLSGLHIDEPLAVTVDCSAQGSSFHDNGVDGVHVFLTSTDSRLALGLRQGSACSNVGNGFNVVESGIADNKNVLDDFDASHNGINGGCKIANALSESYMKRMLCKFNGANGLFVQGGSLTLDGCVLSDNTARGAVCATTYLSKKHVANIKWTDCRVERNGSDGVYVHTAEDDASYKVCVQDMHLRSNAGNGLLLSCDNALCSVELDSRDCSASGNAACGVKFIAPVAMDKGLRFRMDGGDCDDNDVDGFAVQKGLPIRTGCIRNATLSNNGGAGFRAPGGVLQLVRCVASGNLADGFVVARDVADQWPLDCDSDFTDCSAVHNGGSGIVVSSIGGAFKSRVLIDGGEVCDNAAHGIDLSASPGARGKVHCVHMGDNGAHGLVSSASSLAVTENQCTGNAACGLRVLAGAHVVAHNVCTDNAIGVYLAVAGSTVLQNTFGGSSGGVAQVAVEDAAGGTGSGSDIAPFQNAASGTNPLGNQVY